MPKLPEYTATVNAVDPTGGRRASPDEYGAAYSAMGGLSATVSKAAESYLSDVEDREVRGVLVAQSGIRANYAKRLDEAATSGESIEKIREALDADLSKTSESLQTNKGLAAASLHANNTIGVFDERANQIQVHRAVAEATTGGSEFISRTASLVSASGGTYLDLGLADVDAYVQTLPERVSPEKRAEFRRNWREVLFVSAGMAQARKDPEEAIKAMDRGEYPEIKPSERHAITREAQYTINQNRSMQEHTDAAMVKARREASNAAEDKIFNLIRTNRASDAMILANSDLEINAKIRMVSILDAFTKEIKHGEKPSNQRDYNALWANVNADSKDANKIYDIKPIVDAVAAHDKDPKVGINTTDGDRLISMVRNNKDENNQNIASKINKQATKFEVQIRLDPHFLGQPDLQAAIIGDYQSRLTDKISELRAAKINPDVAFDIKSEHYVGSPDFKNTSIANGRASMREVQPKLPQPKTPEELKAIPVGSFYVNPADGSMFEMTQTLHDKIHGGDVADKEAAKRFEDYRLYREYLKSPKYAKEAGFEAWKAERAAEGV